MTFSFKCAVYFISCVVVAMVMALQVEAEVVIKDVKKFKDGSTLPPNVESSYLGATIIARVRPRGWKRQSGAPYRHQKTISTNDDKPEGKRVLPSNHWRSQNKKTFTENRTSRRNESDVTAQGTNQTKMLKGANENITVAAGKNDSILSSPITISVLRSADYNISSVLRSADYNISSNGQQDSTRSSDHEITEQEFVEEVPESFVIQERNSSVSKAHNADKQHKSTDLPPEITSLSTDVSLSDNKSYPLKETNGENIKSQEYVPEGTNASLVSLDAVISSQDQNYNTFRDKTVGEGAQKNQTEDLSARKVQQSKQLNWHDAKVETADRRRASGGANTETLDTSLKSAVTLKHKSGVLAERTRARFGKRLEGNTDLSLPKEEPGSQKEMLSIRDDMIEKAIDTEQWKNKDDDTQDLETDNMQADGFQDNSKLWNTKESDFNDFSPSGDAEINSFSLSTKPDRTTPPHFNHTSQQSHHSKTTPLVSASTVPPTSTDDPLSLGVTDIMAAITNYENGSFPRNERTVGKYLFENSTITKLLSYHGRCEDCMLIKRDVSASLTCGYYDDPAKEFEEWSRKYVDILRHGCPCSGPNHRGQCCHKPSLIVRDALIEVTRMTRDLHKIFLDQCTKCPVDCQWETWGPWSDCPLICDDTKIYSTRRRNRQAEKYRGSPCQGKDREDRLCPTTRTVVGQWLPWSSWGECLGQCEGIRFRERKCKIPTNTVCYKHCEGHDKDVQPCTKSPCCYPRTWTSWGTWTSCSEVDYENKHWESVRYRSCEAQPDYTNKPMCPTPCEGQAMERKQCCHSSWSSWTEWTTCTSTTGNKDLDTRGDCGDGCRNRTRTCIVTPPGCPEPRCEGNNVDHLDCQLTPCCAPPVWSEWESWGSCSVSSGRGIQRRSRHCHPNPIHWRRPTCTTIGCDGLEEDTEERRCQGECEDCTPPTWSSWNEWSVCSFNDNPAKRYRLRSCHRVSQYNTRCRNLKCEGPDVETEICKCEPADWGTWAEWGPCHRLRNMVVRKRSLRCILPINPAYCPPGRCTGLSEQTELCCETPQWETWGQWSSCEVLGDDNVMSQTRTRECHVPPVNIQNGCDERCREGEHWETRECQLTRPTTTTTVPPCINCECKESCEGRKDDNYPSCKRGCQHYIRCCNGEVREQKCEKYQMYDSECRQCTLRTSPTCDANKYDKHRFNLTIDKPSDRECR